MVLFPRAFLKTPDQLVLQRDEVFLLAKLGPVLLAAPRKTDTKLLQHLLTLDAVRDVTQMMVRTAPVGVPVSEALVALDDVLDGGVGAIWFADQDTRHAPCLFLDQGHAI